MFVSRIWWISTIFMFCLNRIVTANQFIPPENWRNIRYFREIDVSNPFTGESYDLTIENISDEPQNQYYIALSEDVALSTSMITAAIKGTEKFLACQTVATFTQLKDGTVIKYALLAFPTPIQPHSQVSIMAKFYHTLAPTPYPEHISIDDIQHLSIKENRYPLSPYDTDIFSLRITGSDDFYELNPPKDKSAQGVLTLEGFKFGPHHDVESFTINEATIVYGSDAPVNKITHLNRDVWISHWANTVQYQEYYEIKNVGAKLKDGFSRLDFIRHQQKSPSGHYSTIFNIALPENSTDHFVTDKIGLVSTHEVRGDTLTLKPRFPIFGGWGYNFTIGWTNPLSQVLRKDPTDDDTYILCITSLNGPSSATYDFAHVTIYLPEGVEYVDVGTALPFDEATVEPEYSFFDLQDGHQKITFNFKNLFDELGKGEVLIKYKYPKTAMYKKPLSIACYWFIGLLSFFVLKNVNIGIY
ncbi:hypothetical protein KAFR_0C06370 [Kazachstania africana CBS 2517]|uniref:Dolichyl-diphosphooligosaccharide--protein glycosyltransferase subunit 1 n=1 Tax=Kazachstania africana (strain ATCC 22294 / BCRC 22015 / CBS 2517 / CECT 1963 / NBRC 1671 / NRRL Y-8276) TaxID=1071382 RepID=H2ATD3_KAZAF|nr:hypothetical protein KAFR_0C06370 [Kazachstania africana CBS 2517]CCF57633.1 hypothetical protein KAFR_0C06370 [Kazachstania africana CBS 2517]